MSIESVMPSNHLILCRPFSSCLQSFPASGSFPTSQFFASGGQSIGASASVLPVNIQDWFPLGWTGWISLQSKELSRLFFNTTVQKHQFFSTQSSLWSNSHICTWLLEKHFLVAQMVQNLPAKWETQVWSLDWEDLLEKRMTIHFNILAWRIPWTEAIRSMRSQIIWHDWVTNTFTLLLIIREIQLKTAN